ncbi:MAG: RagB/SusD family nutrient uptake outer membrane protein [Breznakibacter sp.]|nr:RagB/SusD family nutrient uptake outer membrane protein [Breznakibacter sp.]
MKKLKYIWLFWAVLLLTSSCEQLDLAPEDYYGSSSFWKNEAQVKGYIYGMHSQIRSSATTLWLLGEARGGLQKSGTSSTATSLDYSSPIKNQAFTAGTTGLSSWAGFYGRIFGVNLAIKKVENECKFLSDGNRQYYLGQLYGIRAFYYFWLYRTYGGVPIVTEPKITEGITTAEPLYTPRATPKETFDFIKSDINKSIDNFGANVTMLDKKSIWSKYASLMLKAEVYLWSAKVTTGDQMPDAGDLTIAKNALEEVKPAFSLLPSFSSVFTFGNKGNNEIIFAIRFQENEATNNVSQFVYSDNVFVGAKYSKEGKLMGDTLNLRGNGLLRNEYIFPLLGTYDSNDTRKNTTFLDFYSNASGANGGLILRKFLGTINSNNSRIYVDDIPVYRYADVLLMMAEIKNKQGEDPSGEINEIRQRAYGDKYDAAIHGHTNQGFALNELAILLERDKEFVFENKRWFDMVRMQDAAGKPLAFSSTLPYGSNIPLLNETTEAHKLLWPVDVNTLNNDPKVTQTPGYTQQ